MFVFEKTIRGPLPPEVSKTLGFESKTAGCIRLSLETSQLKAESQSQSHKSKVSISVSHFETKDKYSVSKILLVWKSLTCGLHNNVDHSLFIIVSLKCFTLILEPTSFLLRLFWPKSHSEPLKPELLNWIWGQKLWGQSTKVSIFKVMSFETRDQNNQNQSM